MALESPKYLRAAFANVYNLSLVAGAAVVSVATGDLALGAIAAGAEALWLLFGPDFRPFRRVADRWAREERERELRAWFKQQIGALPEAEWRRASALDDVRRGLQADMQHNPSFQQLLLQTEIEKLSQLLRSFVALAQACARAESYMMVTNRKDLQRQIEVQQRVEKTIGDAAAEALARKNVEVLTKRLGTIVDIEKFLARARGQMTLIENTVRLLRDQVQTMASPDQLGEQLDDLIIGVDAIQTSAKEHEALLSEALISPVGPVTSDAEEPVLETTRVRQ